MPRTTGLQNYSYVHFTHRRIAGAIVDFFQPSGICLEPFKGEGAFYDHLPEGSLWCEISEGRDFFRFTDKVDWIITNPPFSNLTQVFEHAFTLSDHCVFLIPISKYFSSNPRIALADEYGGLETLLHVGTRHIGFDLDFPFAAMKFIRGYTGPVHINRITLQQANHSKGDDNGYTR